MLEEAEELMESRRITTEELRRFGFLDIFCTRCICEVSTVIAMPHYKMVLWVMHTAQKGEDWLGQFQYLLYIVQRAFRRGSLRSLLSNSDCREAHSTSSRCCFLPFALIDDLCTYIVVMSISSNFQHFLYSCFVDRR